MGWVRLQTTPQKDPSESIRAMLLLGAGCICTHEYLRLEERGPNMGPYSRPFGGILGTLKGTYRVYSG